MKITESQLRQIIRKSITETYTEKGYGWHDFKMMASMGDWEGCSDWLEDYCLDRGIRLYSEMFQHMCELASDKTVTEAELEKEMQALSRMY